MPKTPSTLLLLFIVPVLMATPVQAWGDYGHRLIARIAFSQLTPTARAKVQRLIARSAQLDTPECRVDSLADASIWPDCVRGLGDRFAYAATWHYQNISVCAPFDIHAKCPDGNCVTVQIDRQFRILANRQLPDADRLRALAFLTHFVGDMHQPLHIGDKGDRGGNDVGVRYGYYDRDRLNLHWIWDIALAERALTDPPAVKPGSIGQAQSIAMARGTIADWAREGWEISRTLAYGQLPTLTNGCTVPPTGKTTVKESYVRTAEPAIRLQVERAGVRLASLLNAALK